MSISQTPPPLLQATAVTPPPPPGRKTIFPIPSTHSFVERTLRTTAPCQHVQKSEEGFGSLKRREHELCALRTMPHSSAPEKHGGRFHKARAQHGHSANYYIVYPGNTPANHPPTEACMIHSKQQQGCTIQDPGTRGKHETKTQNPWCTNRGVVGCRIEDPGTRGKHQTKTPPRPCPTNNYVPKKYGPNV